jgi:hypothetical protein
MGFWGYQSGQACQILLQFFEGLLFLLSLVELFLFFEELKERETLDAKS